MKTVTTILNRFPWGFLLALAPGLVFGQGQFHLQEATITDIHNAIQAGQITCQGLVQAYVNRAKAYNGMCTALVTEDGAPVPPAIGAVRAGSPVPYPPKTVPISGVLPNFDQYKFRPVQRTAHRIWKDGTDDLRSERSTTVRHEDWDPECRPAERA
jgi:hypothetical protein